MKNNTTTKQIVCKGGMCHRSNDSSSKIEKKQGEPVKRMAIIHAQIIPDKVRQLDCPTKPKVELISAVQELVLRDMNTQA